MCSSESDWGLSPSLSVDGDFRSWICFIVSHAAFCLQLLPSFHPLFILDKCRRIPILWCDSSRNWLLWRWTPSVCLEFWNPVDQVMMQKWSLAPCPGSGDKIPKFCLLLSTQTLPSSANIQAHTHTHPHAHTRTHTRSNDTSHVLICTLSHNNHLKAAQIHQPALKPFYRNIYMQKATTQIQRL